MIDDIKGKYIVDMIKRIFFIILVVLFSIFVYLSIKTKINTNNYEKYLQFKIMAHCSYAQYCLFRIGLRC